MKGPTLSVLITYHNERELLTEALQSLLSQPAPPDEVLVYDDASSSPPHRYIPAGAEVRVVRADTNRGPAHGRNALLREATGEYVHFHDSDDLFVEGWSVAVRERLNASHPDVVLTEIASFDPDGTQHDRIVGLDQMIAGLDPVSFAITHSVLVPCVTCKRVLFESIGGYSEALWQSEDFEAHVRLLHAARTVEVVDQTLVRIRSRPESRSRSRQDEVWTGTVEAIEMLTADIPDLYQQELADKAAMAGSKLFMLGDIRGAKRAFALAGRHATPTFAGRSIWYRLLARTLGPIAAERIAAVRGRPPQA
jgi:glycosyltransferase involved in cell wall biosynthesis